VSSIGFAIVLRLSIVGFFKFLIWVVFIDCIAVGICVATLFWLVDSLIYFADLYHFKKSTLLMLKTFTECF